MSHSLAFINEMKQQLDAELEVLHQDLADVAVVDTSDHVAGKYAPQFHHSDELGEENSTLAEDFADHALNVDVTSTLGKREEEVVSALQAIQDGEYGVCASCSQDIPEDRLRANPAAAVCISCAA